MSETKWTPGPWSVGKSWADHLRSGIWWNAPVFVGEDETHGNMLCKVVAGGPGGLHSTAEEIEANARLIAAAPDLYEALNKTSEFCDLLADAIENSDSLGDVAYKMHQRFVLGRHARELREKALAKAEGEA
jgi:hypothetical protein